MTRTLILALSLLACAGTAAAQAVPRSTAVLEPLPRDLEIQLALSALPPHLRDQATVYALNPAKGFEVARQGTNGFHALVARTGEDTFRGSWPLTEYRTDILYPIAFDAAGSRAHMRVFVDAAEMQARGMSPRALKDTIQTRYRTNFYGTPDRGGVSYMLSPILRTYTNPDQNQEVLTTNVPHVMYFAPNLSNEDIGGAYPTPEQIGYLTEHRHWPGALYPFVILNGPHGYMVQFLGSTERVALTAEYAEMLDRICRINDAWCLPATAGN